MANIGMKDEDVKVIEIMLAYTFCGVERDEELRGV